MVTQYGTGMKCQGPPCGKPVKSLVGRAGIDPARNGLSAAF